MYPQSDNWGGVDMADWHQLGAYTGWVPILQVIAKWGPSDLV